MIVREPWHQILSLNGDGTGTQNMNGDYSVTPQTFYVTPPTGKDFVITHIHMVVAASANLNMTDYGAIAGGLTNGLLWQTVIGGVTMNRFGGLAIKQNIDYEVISNTTITSFAGVAQALMCSFNFPTDYTESFRLTSGNKFQIVARDNLTTLVKHYCACFGRLEYNV